MCVADAPFRLRGGRLARRIVEDAEKDQRVARVPVVEVRRLEVKAEPDAFHQHMSEPGHDAHVVEDSRAEPGKIGKEVAAVQRRSGGNARVIVGQFRAEVQAFLEVGLPARQLPAHREVPAPRLAPQLHPDGKLLLERFCEELAAERFEAGLQRLVDTVADDVEKAGMTAGSADRLGRGRSVAAPRGERGNIDDRKGVHV